MTNLNFNWYKTEGTSGVYFMLYGLFNVAITYIPDVGWSIGKVEDTLEYRYYYHLEIFDWVIFSKEGYSRFYLDFKVDPSKKTEQSLAYSLDFLDLSFVAWFKPFYFAIATYKNCLTREGFLKESLPIAGIK